MSEKLCVLTYKGTVYFYYPSDLYVDGGQTKVYAQDNDGNEFTIIWNRGGVGIAEVVPQ